MVAAGMGRPVDAAVRIRLAGAVWAGRDQDALGHWRQGDAGVLERVLHAGAELAGDVVALGGAGLDRQADGDRGRLDLLHAPELGGLQQERLPLLVLGDLLGGLFDGPHGLGQVGPAGHLDVDQHPGPVAGLVTKALDLAVADVPYSPVHGPEPGGAQPDSLDHAFGRAGVDHVAWA